MPSAEHQVEYAKSGRARCQRCKSLIPKAALRCGVTSFFNGMSSVKWRCLSCWTVPKKLRAASELKGFGLLSAKDQSRLAAL